MSRSQFILFMVLCAALNVPGMLGDIEISYMGFGFIVGLLIARLMSWRT